ncbi:amidase domain-containing protein [uncultured Amnibacterium sp.]|uniref:amidase domain-containing protein n=1 Tax=uncultured Amnibacterium sp. TaxID=1631851 RepID=UPI0035CAEEAC
MRRRNLAIGGAAAVVLVAGGVLGWRAIPYVPPSGQVAQTTSVTRESAYLARYWRNPNPSFGDFGGTDCVNFTSQALHARGWAMTAAWGTSTVLGRHAATTSWVSSTAFARWLATRPDLALPLGDDQRDRVRVGDVVQFDWDASGDRDHTAVVSRVLQRSGRTEIEVAEHSPAGLHDAVDDLIAAHGGHGVVHYWHLLT